MYYSLDSNKVCSFSFGSHLGGHDNSQTVSYNYKIMSGLTSIPVIGTGGTSHISVSVVIEKAFESVFSKYFGRCAFWLGQIATISIEVTSNYCFLLRQYLHINLLWINATTHLPFKGMKVETNYFKSNAWTYDFGNV